jgi:hypothetical protein
MNGPLICYECRIFLKEDEEHEKEQQAYEDRRQAKYKAQLAGDNEVAKTDKGESRKEEQHTHEGHTYEVLKSPSLPRDLSASKLHTHFNRRHSKSQKRWASSTTAKTANNIPSPQSFHVPSGNPRSSTNSTMDRTCPTIPDRIPTQQKRKDSGTYHHPAHNQTKQHDDSTFPRYNTTSPNQAIRHHNRFSTCTYDKQQW